MKEMPKDIVMGELAKDALGDGAVRGKIAWEREEPGVYQTKPFRFTVTKVEEDDYVRMHWKLYDWRKCGSYCRASKAACQKHAQDIIDIESGKKKAPKPKKQKAIKATKYEGLFHDGKRVPPAGYHRCPECNGACFVEGEKKKEPCRNCNGEGAIKDFGTPDRLEQPGRQKEGLFD